MEDGSTVQPGKPVFKLRVGAGGGGSSAPAAAAKPKAEAKEAATTAKIPDSPPPSSKPPSQPIGQIPTSSVKTPSPAKASGPSGSAAPAPGARTESRVKINRMRGRIAERLKDAQNTYAMLTTFNEIDMR